MMKKKDAWQEFDDEFLKPFEKKGEDPTCYWRGTKVFSYMQVREVALEAFKRGKKAKDEMHSEKLQSKS